MRSKRHIGAVWLIPVLLCSMAPGAQGQTCKGDAPSKGIVRAILDARTVVLEDGQQVRLAGIEIPPASERAAAEDSPEARARQYLNANLPGRPVLVRHGGAMVDRYGRFEANVFIEGNTLEGWVQEAMVARGLARVAARAGDRACAAALWGREEQARRAKLGLWADERAAVRRADDPASVLGLRGRFALVEGRVLSVRESGGTVYVNFGRRWSEDFTVTVAKRQERTLAAAGLDVRRLERRMVRVRGFVEERGGPWIEVTRAEQVEVLGN